MFVSVSLSRRPGVLVPKHPLGGGNDLNELHMSILRTRRVNIGPTTDDRRVGTHDVPPPLDLVIEELLVVSDG
jgi:hypothetical protein